VHLAYVVPLEGDTIILNSVYSFQNIC